MRRCCDIQLCFNSDGIFIARGAGLDFSERDWRADHGDYMRHEYRVSRGQTPADRKICAGVMHKKGFGSGCIPCRHVPNTFVQILISWPPHPLTIRPEVRYVPEWFPGAGFKRFAEEDQRLCNADPHSSLEYVKESLKVSS